MQGMSRPAAPPTTAPIAPMLPAITPAEQIDIFAPAQMASGGLADLGRQDWSVCWPQDGWWHDECVYASGNDPRPTDEEMGVLANQLQP